MQIYYLFNLNAKAFENISDKIGKEFFTTENSCFFNGQYLPLSRKCKLIEMNRILLYSLIVIIMMIFFSSCTLEKRVYLPGYNVEWNKSGESKCISKDDFPYIVETSTKSISVCSIDSNASVRHPENYLLASTSNIIPVSTTIFGAALPVIDLNIEKSGVKVISQNAPELVDSCDVIILKSGVQIRAKVLEIGLSEIKFKKCSYLEGPIIVVSNADVYRIQYANGTEEIISQNDTESDYVRPTTTVKKKSNLKPEGFGEVGFYASIIGLFFAGIPLGLLAFIFGIISITKIRNNPEKFKGEGFAFISLMLGLIDVLLVLILLSGM
jgi:hypothetical protein